MGGTKGKRGGSEQAASGSRRRLTKRVGREIARRGLAGGSAARRVGSRAAGGALQGGGARSQGDQLPCSASDLAVDSIHPVASPPRLLCPLAALCRVRLAPVALNQHLPQQRLRLLRHRELGRQEAVVRRCGELGGWGGLHARPGRVKGHSSETPHPPAPLLAASAAPRHALPATSVLGSRAHHVATQRLLLSLKVPPAQRIGHHGAQLGRLLQPPVRQHDDRRLRGLRRGARHAGTVACGRGWQGRECG